MGIFSTIKDVSIPQSSKDRVYISEGNWLLECIDNVGGHTREGNVPFFAATFKVLEAPPGAGCRAGDRVSWFQKFDTYKDLKMGSVKSYVSALLGVDAAAIDESILDGLTSAANPGAGHTVRARGRNTATGKCVVSFLPA